MELDLSSAIVLGLGGLVTGLIGLRSDRLGLGAALILAGLGALLLDAWYHTGYPPHLGWLLAGLASLCFVFRGLRSDWLARAVTRLVGLARAPRWQWGAIALAGPLAAILLPRPQTGVNGTIVWLPVESNPAVTDLGRPVPLRLPRQAETTAAMWQAEEEVLRDEHLLRRVIQTAPANPAYNCHGWVFASGRYLIPDEAIEAILRDNGYQTVARAAAGDLVVYYGDSGQVTHTGIVRTATPSGLVLVESKWSWAGRFLHRPEDQLYGMGWAFYHSARRGHVLRGLEDELPEKAAPPLAGAVREGAHDPRAESSEALSEL